MRKNSTRRQPIENRRKTTVDTLPIRTNCLYRNTSSMTMISMNRKTPCTVSDNDSFLGGARGVRSIDMAPSAGSG